MSTHEESYIPGNIANIPVSSEVTIIETENSARRISYPTREDSFKKDWRFWIIIVALAAVGTLGTLEGTVVSTALPTIIADLHGENLYIWVVNAYFLTATAFQPLYGELSDILGRKIPILTAVALFMLGSGVSGGASSMTALIAGRTVQGMGGGGVLMMIEVIVSDLVPIRQRGTYLGIVLGACTLGVVLGPIIGGLFVEYVTWRWAFWINLPVGAAAGLLLLIFFHSTIPLPKDTGKRLLQIDFIGNLILLGSLASILLALSYGGSMYGWVSSKVLAPLLVGLFGLGLWISYEFSRFCSRPTVPLKLWSNRTSAVSFLVTFLQAVIINWAGYFLPVYFQGVLGSSPGRSGVQLLPTLIPLIAAGVIGGAGVQITGRYKPFQAVGSALVAIGLGVFSLLNIKSSTGVWIGFQIIFGVGSGLTTSTLLQSAQAPFPDSDTATITGFYAFVRSFGYIWGVAISAAIFDNRTGHFAYIIADSTIRNAFEAGGAYQRATKAFIDGLSSNPVVQSQVLTVFQKAMENLWNISLAFGLTAFLLTLLEKEITLRKDLENTQLREKEEVGMEKE